MKANRIAPSQHSAVHPSASTLPVSRWWSVPIYATVIVTFIIGASGCLNISGGNYGSNVKSEQKTTIVPGKTTKTDILRELGNPDQRIDLGNNQEQFSYITITMKRGFFLPGGTNGMGGLSSNTEFWILFDKDIVKETGERPTTKTPSLSK